MTRKKVIQVIPRLKKGTLGIKFSNPTSTRRKKLTVLARRIGEKRVIGKLRAIQVLNKNRNPILSNKARLDAKFIAGAFKGKRFVGSGKGFG